MDRWSFTAILQGGSLIHDQPRPPGNCFIFCLLLLLLSLWIHHDFFLWIRVQPPSRPSGSERQDQSARSITITISNQSNWWHPKRKRKDRFDQYCLIHLDLLPFFFQTQRILQSIKILPNSTPPPPLPAFRDGFHDDYDDGMPRRHLRHLGAPRVSSPPAAARWQEASEWGEWSRLSGDGGRGGGREGCWHSRMPSSGCLALKSWPLEADGFLVGDIQPQTSTRSFRQSWRKGVSEGSILEPSDPRGKGVGQTWKLEIGKRQSESPAGFPPGGNEDQKNPAGMLASSSSGSGFLCRSKSLARIPGSATILVDSL